MKNLTITCPECKHEFSADQSLKHQLNHLLEEERNLLAAKFVEKEKIVNQREQELNKKETSIDQLVNEKLKGEKSKMKTDLEEKVKAEYLTEVEGLRKELDEKQLKLNKSKQFEIELEQVKRETNEREYAIRLNYEKELSLERSKIESSIVTREADRNEMKLAERDKQLNDLRKQLDEMKRKAEQGSMQTQGEVQELALEELLTDLFKFDTIHEVGKGQNGADIIHVVRTPYGKECGIIAYESKRTKSFNEGWINKLKDDMREHNANHGILVTEVMPKDMLTFGLRNGVWVCTFKEITGLAAAIREICIIETNIKSSEINRTEKIHALYNYLMSNEFKRGVGAILEEVSEMRENIDRERRFMMASWKKREKNIDQMGFLVADIVGSIDGISGNSLGPINGLALLETSEVTLN
ncbi:MAG: DUF2130 domain-containing protein [Saprospiraceae bacterium]